MDQRLNLQGNTTFFHKITQMILESKFEEISEINYKTICINCMKFKKERETHCGKIDKCVYLFNFRFVFLSKHPLLFLNVIAILFLSKLSKVFISEKIMDVN